MTDNKPTSKQLNLILKLEFQLAVIFNGNTKKDASHFITKYLPEYLEMKERYFDEMYYHYAY
ncbi:hypothetical protein KLEB273_gp119 [Bacillus phage vB_BauM_KLEB27-3]|nr:hypothetical protein KLEB273_gp119 [Bacillus phage vB_BauM_KLEB27-3]